MLYELLKLARPGPVYPVTVYPVKYKPIESLTARPEMCVDNLDMYYKFKRNVKMSECPYNESTKKIGQGFLDICLCKVKVYHFCKYDM